MGLASVLHCFQEMSADTKARGKRDYTESGGVSFFHAVQGLGFRGFRA